MSKKRDALRRGIRALIDETTRELAAFEGREPRPGPPGPAADDKAPTDAPGGRPDPAAPARGAGQAPALNGESHPAETSAVAAADAAPRAVPTAGAGAPKRPAEAAGRGKRRPPRAPETVSADTVNPMQAQSRTGVCRSYFINHECWRVPNAYCNTALQVCVIRNCPVYHLHKDALERRFAKKFKHFW